MEKQGSYLIRLAARNEGIEYTDDQDVYRFDVSQRGKEWTIRLPGSKGDKFESHELTPEEEARIIPRITKYLSRIKWFGIFPRSYRVRIVREQYAGHDLVGEYYSRSWKYRTVITRDAQAVYRVYREQRDESNRTDSGMALWRPLENTIADNIDRATTVAKEMLAAIPEDR